MGYPLLRAADYPRVDAFLDAMANASGRRPPRPVRASQSAVDEAERFHAFLAELFDAIGRREELVGSRSIGGPRPRR